MNAHTEQGTLRALLAALDVLVTAHTRGDEQAGFVVETMPALHPASDTPRWQYIYAWQTVRAALGYETRPAVDRENAEAELRETLQKSAAEPGVEVMIPYSHVVRMLSKMAGKTVCIVSG